MNSKPIILSEKLHNISDLEALRNTEKIWAEKDEYKVQLEELFCVINPSAKTSQDYKKLLDRFITERTSTPKDKFVGTYVYFPWSGNLIHILDEEEYFLVRTNRNKNIITADEQNKLHNLNVAVLGLSIGNGMALSLAYSGISKNMKLADFDTLELSNLNRIRASVTDLGLTKIDITAREIYEIDPYAKIKFFEDGLTNSTLDDFVTGDPKPDVIFEAIDDFEMKIRVRMQAKQAGIPVIMLTNLGDKLLVDVERYDLDKDIIIFNGMIGDVAGEILSKPITETDKQKYAVAIVGKENLSNRVLESVLEVNKTLVGRPQVMSTVTIGGGLASYLVRRMFTENTLPSGRSLINFETLLGK